MITVHSFSADICSWLRRAKGQIGDCTWYAESKVSRGVAACDGSQPPRCVPFGGFDELLGLYAITRKHEMTPVVVVSFA
jgi:hypothetical protein